MAPKNPRPTNNINRPWEPGELAILKLAKNLNSEGLFWPEQFNRLSFWKDTDGNHTIVRRDKAGKLRLVRVDKKYAGRFNRLLVEEIPPQVEAIFRDMESAGKIPKGTYEEFVAWQSSGVRKAFNKSAETTQRTGIDTEGGHLLELQSKRAGSGPFAHAHTGDTIIDEGRNPYPNAEGILMPGNNPKKNDPGWHLDPKQMDAAGLPSTWAELMKRFLTGQSGANVERISEERLRRVVDRQATLDQVVGEQDQENQKLAFEEGENYRRQQETEEGRKQLLIENQDKQPLDPRTGLTSRRGGLINNIIGLVPPVAAARDLMIFGKDFNEARQNANALNSFNAVMSGLQATASAAELVPHKGISSVGRLAGWPLGWVQERGNELAGVPQQPVQPTELPEPTITQNTYRGFGYIVDNFQQAYENLIYGDRDTSAYDRKIDLLHEEAQRRAAQLNSTKTFRN